MQRNEMSQNKVWSRMTDKRFIKWKTHFMLKCDVMKKMNRKSTVLAPGSAPQCIRYLQEKSKIPKQSQNGACKSQIQQINKSMLRNAVENESKTV